MKSQDKLQQLRPKTSTSSYSSDQPFQGRTSPQLKSERINKSENITWTSSPLTSYLVTPNRKRDYEEDITPKTTLLGTIRMDPTVAAETEPEPKPKPMSAKRNENPISQTNPKNSFGESLLTKQQKKNDKLLYDQSKEVLGESSIEAMMESLESVKKKERRRSARSSSIKRSGVRMSPGTKRLYFKPLTSAATVSSDQEEVISKWRKRLGTNSPPRPGHRGPSTPIIASSHLRNSQVLRVQGTSDDSYLNLGSTNFLIPEKDSAEMSLEEVELKKLLKPMTGKHPNEVFSANEEKEIFLRIEMEKTKKQIQFLEELARVKIQKLEAIQWKKKRALEEEAALNEKLEKLLWKIQQLRESDSFAELLDKQTQVFATKRLRPNIN